MIPGWKEESEGDYLEILGHNGPFSPMDLARRLGVSESCAVFWLSELAKEGKVRILAVELSRQREQEESKARLE